MHQANPTPSPPPPAARYKVLLVDDDAAVQRSMVAALERDLDIATCDSGERALTMLAHEDFHVVCSDYSMGGMNGIELLERVARLPEPVGCLLVTGSGSFMDRSGGKASEHYVLMKPVDPQRMLTMILQLARTAEMKRNAQRVNAASPR